MDVTLSTVELPNERFKGMIIGKEGKNIRAFEEVTGVKVIVDDTIQTPEELAADKGPGRALVPVIVSNAEGIANSIILQYEENNTPAAHARRIHKILLEIQKEKAPWLQQPVISTL